MRGRIPPPAGSTHLLLPRRLAAGSPLAPTVKAAPGLPVADSTGPGVYYQLGQVEARSDSVPDVPRGDYRNPPTAGAAQPGEDRHYRGGGPAAPWSPAGTGQDMAPVPGLPLESSRRPAGLPTTHAAFSAAFPQELPAGPGPPIQAGPLAPDDSPPFSEVESPRIPALGQPTEGPPAYHNGDHGRLPHGMGRALPGPQCVWGLVPLQGTSPYQRTGVSGCHPVSPSLPPPCLSPYCSYPHGQCNSGGLHKQTRGHPLHTPERPSGGAVDMVQAQGYYSDRLVHSRAGQSNCGLPVPRPRSPLGVDPPPPGHGHYYPNARSPSRGSVCVGTQCPAPEVLCEGPGSGSVANRRLLNSVGGVHGIRFSPDLAHPPNSTEGEAGPGYRPPHCPVVAEENVVPRNDNPSSGVSENPPRSQGCDLPADIGDPAPKAVRPPPDCLALVREAGAQAGLSERAAAFVARSRRDSTREAYNSRLAGYFSWCESHGVDPRSASLTDVADFLITLFDKGLLVSTIRGYRSAIAAIHTGFPDGSSMSTTPSLTGLVRAFFLERPPKRKLLPAWSLPRVLEALAKAPFEPLAEASLRDVTIKTVFLMAIASGQRRSALHALSAAPGHIRWERGGVRLIPNPSYVAKNQTASSKPVEIFIQPLSAHSSVSEDKVWCPVRALKYYWSRTKDRRSGDQLFMITKEPFSPASRDVISKWIVAAIQAAGPSALSPGVTPRAHDTRSISASWALFSGVSVKEIQQAAYWQTPNSFISFYLRDVPAAEPSFSRAALLAAAHSR